MRSFYGFTRLLLAAICCCCVHAVSARSEVHVETAGTLSTLIPSSESQLKVTGSINGTDIKHLRKLINNGGVTSLDISEVRIVSGGQAYYDNNKTANDVIGASMFRECVKLKTIILPTTVTEILASAFSNSGLQKVDIPNSVAHLGIDAFAYCNSLSTVVIGSHVAKLDQGVFYNSPVKTAYVKPVTPPDTPAYLFSSNPKIIVYTEVVSLYRNSGWKDYGTIAGRLEDTYPKEPDAIDIINSISTNFFEDAACTLLKAECAAMTDEALTAAFTDAGLPDFMVEMAIKLKNNAWADYEKDFRIHTYKPYSDANYWNERLMSTGGSYMGNPTGIFADRQQPLYVFVDTDVPEDATLYIAGCIDNDLITNSKTGQPLKKGLNVVDTKKNALYYILYTADTRPQTKTLAEWPDIKIHIEGGNVNGYYDAARRSDADYVAILKQATHDLFTVKSDHALFNFRRATYKKVWPKTIDRSICWFDSLAVWQAELMGYCTSVAYGKRAAAPFFLTGGEAIFPTYYNNPYFAIQGDAEDDGYANSTPYRTSYNSLECIANSFDVSKPSLDDWCAAHECGHNNQGAINLEGGTESSNNLFSNYIRYHDGLATSKGSPLSTVMEEAAQHTPFFVRGVDSQLRMYWQLYLYYHLARKNTAFYPTLFKALREDPLSLWAAATNSSLKFVTKVCDVAQEDLTDFFTAWGFFEPMNRYPIQDYGQHTMTVRQAEINKTLKKISQYPKNRTLLFVEDRADYVLTNDFLTTPGQRRRDSDQVGQCGQHGQFTDYLNPSVLGGSAAETYTYIQADSLYAMSGNGGIGFLMLNTEGTMRYAANANIFCIPSSVTQDFSIYSINADGTLHETTYAGSGAEYVHLNKTGTLADSLTAHVLKATVSGTMNTTDMRHLRKLTIDGNLSSIDLTDATVLGGFPAETFHNCQQLISILLPLKLNKIGSCAFANSGLHTAIIPDNVTTIGEDAYAYCPHLQNIVIGTKVKNIDKGAFYSSNIKHAYIKALTPPTLSSYTFTSKPTIHVFASALHAYKTSPWAQLGTIIADLDNYDHITAPPQHSPKSSPQIVNGKSVNCKSVNCKLFDLFGRHVTNPKPGTIYIRNRKKIITPLHPY